MAKRILVTSALPYANGHLHMGHLVEAIQTDIFVRALKSEGHDAIYLCASDTHGTPIELNARKVGVEPEQLVSYFHQEFQADYARFGIHFDCYYTTHSPENRRFAELFFTKLREAGHIYTRPVMQLYCPRDQRFLPDRYVRGRCPKCGADDQYGDVCEVCHGTYSVGDLGDARCVLCGTPPEARESTHYFVRLSDFEDFLRRWVAEPGRLQESTRNFVQTWLDEGLQDWDVSRDGPYFGFPIPGERDKYLYVWLDAPVGYVATTQKYCDETGRDFGHYWHDPSTEIIHVIGKDIVYFHTLFWPAMLHGVGFNVPTRVVSHGMLRIDGTKMSKSRGTFITARQFAAHIDPEMLRFYFASKLSPNDADIDLSFDDLIARVNADMVNNLANLVSRAVSFTSKHFGGRLSSLPAGSEEVVEAFRAHADAARRAYGAWNFSEAVQEIGAASDVFNRAFQEAAPWKQVKGDPEAARATCTLAVNACRELAALIAPILPSFAGKVFAMLRVPPLELRQVGRFDLTDHRIGRFERLANRIERAQVDRLLDQVRRETATAEDPGVLRRQILGETSPPEDEVEPLADQIGIDTFAEVDLRVGRVVAAGRVEGARKLLRLDVDLGPLGRRTIFAGLRAAFADPSLLEGKQIALVANLAPRKMRFGVSEGMVLAAGPADDRLSVVEVPPPARPGDRIH